MNVVKLGNLNGFTGGNYAGNVYGVEGVAPTMNTCEGGGRQPMIIEVIQATKDGKIDCEVPGVVDLSIPHSKTRRGRVIEGGRIVPTLQTSSGGISVLEENDMVEDYRIRKLTPKECFRLMNFPDKKFDRAAEVNSNTQLYKQSGNAIVVNCLVAILGQLFEGKEEIYKEVKAFE